MQLDIEAETRQAWSWALSEGNLKVVPELTATAYKIKRGKKTIGLLKVKLVIHINNSKHVGKELYKQDREMSNKIDEIYLHYFRKSEAYKVYVRNEDNRQRT
tara:strand:+ start:621 stop:926 length:306 start_codon:yes stop_codon:yes gene_type:complete